jgi:Sec-independent protein translocase protein TatA
MFDFSYAPLLLAALVGLILLRPHDWLDLARTAGRFMKTAQAYYEEWLSYLEFSGSGSNRRAKSHGNTSVIDNKINTPEIWPQTFIYNKNISMRPV